MGQNAKAAATYVFNNERELQKATTRSFGSSASSQEAVQVIFIVASQIRTSQHRLLRFAMLEIKLPDNPLSVALPTGPAFLVNESIFTLKPGHKCR